MSTSAREDILRGLRRALDAAPGVVDDVAALPPARPAAAPERVDRFAERAADYRGTVTRCAGRGAIGAAIDAVLGRHGACDVLVADGLPAAWRPAGAGVRDAGAAGVGALDAADGVVTGCALAIAETGTIVLDGGALSGRRLITLVPDLHVCVVLAAQVVATTADALRLLAPAIGAGAPVTLVSGPSATSDIELSRVEGVHGPRRLEVVVVDEL